MMHLTNATFTIHSCLVEIDGWMADVSSKWSLIEACCCNVNAMDAENWEKAEDLHYSPVGDTGIYACSYPPLVELAARHWLWTNGDGPWDDVPVEIKSPLRAAMDLSSLLAESRA